MIEDQIRNRIQDMTWDDVVPKEKTLNKLKNRLTDEEFRKLFSKSHIGLTEDIVQDTNVYNQLTDRDVEIKEVRTELVGMFGELNTLLDNLAEGNLTRTLYKGKRTLEA